MRSQTHERLRILNLVQDNDRIYVTGPAGSGKTWLAFEQAKRWTAQDLRVGVVTFNRGLSTYLVNKNLELDESNRVAWVGNFHTYAQSIGSSAGNLENIEEHMDTHEKNMLDAVAKLSGDQKFDAWVVDEAQDFFESWWRVLLATMKDPVNGKLAIFGDPEQSVYGQRGYPEGFFAKIRFEENLRNSQQIAESVQGLVDNKIIARGPSSFGVEFVVAPTIEDVIETADEAVARIVDQELWNVGEVALLTTKHQHPVHKEKTKIHSDKEAYWDELWAATDVFYGTVTGFKGLERSVVVLAIDGFHDDADRDDTLYVGMTRARDRLVVVGIQSEILRLQNR